MIKRPDYSSGALRVGSKIGMSREFNSGNKSRDESIFSIS